MGGGARNGGGLCPCLVAALKGGKASLKTLSPQWYRYTTKSQSDALGFCRFPNQPDLSPSTDAALTELPRPVAQMLALLSKRPCRRSRGRASLARRSEADPRRPGRNGRNPIGNRQKAKVDFVGSRFPERALLEASKLVHYLPSAPLCGAAAAPGQQSQCLA